MVKTLLKNKVAGVKGSKDNLLKFEFRGPGPLAMHVLLQLVIFMTKTKISQKNLRMGYYLFLKCCRRQVPYFSLPRPNHFRPKYHGLILNRNKCTLVVYADRNGLHLGDWGVWGIAASPKCSVV